MYRAAALFVLTVGVGCVLPTSPPQSQSVTVPLSKKKDEARAQLLQQVPIGSDMATVPERLQALGFKITTNSPQKCLARRDEPDAFPVTVSWLVVAIGERGQLKEMEVNVGFNGP